MSLITQAQLYFPPVNSNTWDTTSPLQLSWCDNKIDSLYQFLDSTDSKAFILLKDGKIVLKNISMDMIYPLIGIGHLQAKHLLHLWLALLNKKISYPFQILHQST